MTSIIISKKLNELYSKEGYEHPQQTRPEPGAGITGELNDEEDNIVNDDKSKDNIKAKNSNPRNWKFKGPRIPKTDDSAGE